MKQVRIVLVEMKSFLDDRLIVKVQRQPRMVVSARSLEAARLDLKYRIVAIAIIIGPFSDRIAKIGRLDVRGPVTPVGVDSAHFHEVEVGQDVSGFWRDHVFLPRWRHDARHPAQDAAGSRIIAQSALGLVGHALFQDFLIFRRQRGLLAGSGRLGWIELYSLTFTIRVVAGPLTLPVRIFRVIGGGCTAKRQHQRGSHCKRPHRASIQHDSPSDPIAWASQKILYLRCARARELSSCVPPLTIPELGVDRQALWEPQRDPARSNSGSARPDASVGPGCLMRPSCAGQPSITDASLLLRLTFPVLEDCVAKVLL